jgi:2-phosphoglycerate kinase
MAKTLVINEEEKTRIPFLRGILTRSLQEAGLPFSNAYNLASEIRNDLSDVDEISVDELRERVIYQLKKLKNPKILERYQALAELQPVIYVKNLEGHMAPYSNEQFRRELEIIGLSADESATAVEKMHQHLIGRGNQVISTNHLGYLTYRCLHLDPDYGPEVARRYLVWVNYCRSGRPLIILIGGTAGCGKSTIATALANRLDIVRTQSTDMLREVMRMMIPERLLPVLHTSSFAAWKTMPVKPCNKEEEITNQLIAGYRTQADLLSVPCEAVIQRALKEKVSLLLEGVHVQPSMLKTIPKDQDAIVIHIMLGVLKQKELRKRIKGRGTEVPQRRSERYLANFEDIWRLQAYLLDEADLNRVPIVVNSSKESAMKEVMKIVVDRLEKEFSSTAAEVFGEEHKLDKAVPD